jgi:hypothetical protein
MVKKVMYGCLAMAVVSALAYALVGVGVLKAGELTGDAIPPFYYVIPAGYFIGGLLVLLRKRWLLIIGLILNALAIVGFYTMYSARPDVMLSAPGLIIKIAQILLEIGLVYLIVTYRRGNRASE